MNYKDKDQDHSPAPLIYQEKRFMDLNSTFMKLRSKGDVNATVLAKLGWEVLIEPPNTIYVLK